MRALPYMSEKAAGAARAAGVAVRVLYRDGPRGLFHKIMHWHQHRIAQRRIDAEYGTETLSMVAIEDFSASSPNVSYAYMYGPTPAFDFNAILKRLPIAYSEFVFVDLGCGKGLALMLASRFGFQRILGVEFGRNLYEVALTNLEKFRKLNVCAQPIDVILEDAAEFQFLEEPLVLYLYNPFGPEVLRKVLQNLGLSLSKHPRNCWVVYLRPLHRELLAGCGFLQTHEVSGSGDLGVPYALYTHGIGG